MQDEWTGESVEAAVGAALRALGQPRERVEIEVLEEPGGGVFGIGRRPARVRVRLRPSFGEAATAFVRAVVAYLGEDVEVREAERVERGWRIEVAGRASGALIGRRGQTLRALEYLAEVHAARRSGERAALVLDVNDYRRRREEALVKMARRAAQEVLRSRRERRLEAMTSYERRIVHMALQGMRGVTTESEGEEPNRRVVIRPTAE
ncbi:MAG: Jag N-terminal domain-containing protein [Firmicutes bacterium]|nr:Jag N-terminal domain-containing protein [Bacillota bacterium]